MTAGGSTPIDKLRTTPVDAAQRERIATDLSSSMFVEAGAGTGKTASLVERIVALIARGEATVDQIVAITFTRAAASELRERIAARLEARAAADGIDAEERIRLWRAVEEIDAAAFQTIDSFALALLRDRPLEAGLPPVIETLDAVQAEIAFRERWDEWLDSRLDEDEFAEAIARVDGLELASPLSALFGLAQGLHRRYQMLRDVEIDVPARQSFDGPASVVASAGVLEELAQYNKDPEDRLLEHIGFVSGVAADLERVGVDSGEALEILARSPALKTSLGQQGNWDLTSDGVNACRFAKDELKDLQLKVDAELYEARAAALAPLLRDVAGFVLEYAEERRRDGVAEFHDLLVWTRDLLQSRPDVRRHFRRRFGRLLVDEFQDTDPLQTEIVFLLTSSATGSALREPQDAVPDAGALFVVGDPKQSIYRFRRADIDAVATARQVISGEPVLLVHNFRSHRAILDWANSVFSRWMGAADRPGQARYVDLSTDTPAPDGEPAPGVHHFGEPLDRLIGTVRAREADEIAAIARSVGRGGWQVRDGGPDGGMRAARWGDLCILLRHRSGLEVLERALEDAGAPYSLAGQSLVWASQQVRDLMAALAAIDDPSDQVSLVGALRSPVFACSDPDLAEWVARDGVFDFLVANDLDGPVAEAFAALAGYHEMRMRAGVPELIERFVRERRLRELASGGPLRRSRLRLIEVVIEQARVLAGAGRPSLREFVEWVGEQAAADARISEGGAGEADLDSVRVMTVHSAKGLEFPIVLLAGINSQPPSGPGAVLTGAGADAGRLAVRLGRKEQPFEWGDYEGLAEREKDGDEAENVRVMYVAATRAMDHLVVSMCRRERDRSSLAAQLAEQTDESTPWRELTALPEGRDASARATGTEAGAGDAGALEEFASGRKELIEESSRPRLVGATALKAPVDAPADEESERREAEPWRRGRAASAIGRAVHAVLQDVGLAAGDGLTDLAERHSAQEDVSDFTDEVSRLAAATLEAPVVKRAAERGWRREVYVAAPVGADAAVEGFIDLLFEDESGGIVIVDYKTDRVGEGDSLADAAAAYVPQLGAYALATEAATGRKVTEVWVVFSRRAAAGLDAEYRLPSVSEAAETAREAALAVTSGA